MKDVPGAIAYTRARLVAGELTADHVTALVVDYQRRRGLGVDGRPGPMTRAALDRDLLLLRPVAITKAWPLRQLPDGRRPQITSSFRSRNPDRPTHYGVDLFYPYNPGVDPPVRVGDGGASRGSDGKPKWWIPDREPARAAADGEVIRASKLPTGFRVAVAHADGNETIYAHLRDLRVAVGQQVRLGDPVGEVGDNPGAFDAEHLHFEVRTIGGSVDAASDPELWLAGATYFTEVP